MKNKVKEERTRCKLTQQELADKLGVTRQTVFSIETGKYIPSTLLGLKISRILDRKVEDIFILEETD